MSSTKSKHIITVPFGNLLAEVDNNELIALAFTDKEAIENSDQHPIFERLQDELNAYFTGELKKFTIPLNPQGSSFQRKVWAKLRSVPFGARITYSELAEIYGDRRAVRAVAAANGANPIAILIPCHRIIGKGGNLTGYAWGLERKKALLQLEMKYTPQHDLFS
ncbi:MAG: methylated-DNA--[protein]-cysteine S-methyltransferase [Crocinitomicaceae bacterium]|nr:methylated-DNA--[protein]-cysteine S-methyltransferase [Crocinitomicaceae bacterium]